MLGITDKCNKDVCVTKDPALQPAAGPATTTQDNTQAVAIPQTVSSAQPQTYAPPAGSMQPTASMQPQTITVTVTINDPNAYHPPAYPPNYNPNPQR